MTSEKNFVNSNNLKLNGFSRLSTWVESRARYFPVFAGVACTGAFIGFAALTGNWLGALVVAQITAIAVLGAFVGNALARGR